MLFEKRNLAGAACLHALNEAEALSMREFGLRNPIAIIPNGVILPQSDESTTGAATWEVPGVVRRKVLLFLGRIHPKKGIATLLQAWHQVRIASRDSGWKLAIAGWDQVGHEEDLKQLAGKLGIAEDVYFIGPQFQKMKEVAFARAAAFVLPSYSEGMPVAVLEAWASRLPVLMTQECNLSEGFEANAAIKIEASAEGVASGLRELFRMSDGERIQMGLRGRALVEERFTWPSVAEKMLRLYKWVAGRGDRPEFVING
jgi:poly(glycerol-phosphate) alpha-glucosyltransferase